MRCCANCEYRKNNGDGCQIDGDYDRGNACDKWEED